MYVTLYLTVCDLSVHDLGVRDLCVCDLKGTHTVCKQTETIYEPKGDKV